MTDKITKKDDKDQHKEKKPKEQTKPIKKIEQITKGIKRIAGKDVSGDYSLSKALLKIRGIGKSLNCITAKIMHRELKFPLDKCVGDLTDEQIEHIDDLLLKLDKYGVPNFMLNRRKDPVDGKSKHVIMNDLIFADKQSIDKEKNNYSWKGYRHAYSQKVRGQRTRNTGRKGMSVGVLRKAVLSQSKAGAGGQTKTTTTPQTKPAEKK